MTLSDTARAANFSLQRTAGLRFRRFAALWPAAAEFRWLADSPMNAMRFLTIFWLAVQCASLAQAQEPLPLAARVNEAKLIVVGTLRGHATISRHQDSSTVQIEKVLFGSAPTNKTLLVWYTSDRLLTPGIASSTHQISATNRYICFLTHERATQPSIDMFQARAIGKQHYAHDAFELATAETLKEVGALIAERSKKN